MLPADNGFVKTIFDVVVRFRSRDRRLAGDGAAGE